MRDREGLPDRIRATSCIIRNVVTNGELGHYDTFDEGIAALAEMVHADPDRGRSLALILLDYGRPFNSILGEELVRGDL